MAISGVPGKYCWVDLNGGGGAGDAGVEIEDGGGIDCHGEAGED